MSPGVIIWIARLETEVLEFVSPSDLRRAGKSSAPGWSQDVVEMVESSEDLELPLKALGSMVEDDAIMGIRSVAVKLARDLTSILGYIRRVLKRLIEMV
jgi:hypothetical protein